ncbi:uncharacterized protein LOC122501146 [Leptopilina heterotoma]|uniref:uncharacterized protein LOC122501146 n=1 Tax=Leptopilina heterotoma TaxID=63436 RepID=UPI001CA9600E|nr:uncharacterized protein LOC122501146 [Leptopilina heterotoma]
MEENLKINVDANVVNIGNGDNDDDDTSNPGLSKTQEIVDDEQEDPLNVVSVEAAKTQQKINEKTMQARAFKKIVKKAKTNFNVEMDIRQLGDTSSRVNIFDIHFTLYSIISIYCQRF